MKIKTTSWHYRLVEYMDYRPRNSLCLYFWQVVLAMIKLVLLSILFAVVSIVAILCSICFILGPIIWFIGGIQTGHWFVEHPFTIAVIIGAATIVIVLVANFPHLYRHLSWIIGKIWDDGERREEPEKSPNLLLEFLKAKKEKVCPTITFVHGGKYGE